LYGLGQATVDDVSYLPLAVIPNTSTTPVWPALAAGTGTQYGSPTYYPTYSFGLRMPASGNNAISDIGSFTSYFTQISLIGSEHCNFVSLKTLYSEYGILSMTASGGTVNHGIAGTYWTCEVVRYPVGSLSSGYYALATAIGINVARCDLESYTDIVIDGASKLYGEIGFNIIAAATSYLAVQYGAGGTALKLKRLEAAPGLVASLPAGLVLGGLITSGTAAPNWFYRDATVNVQPNGATITAIAVDATTLTGITSGLIRVPSGHSITVTWSGGTPAWQWQLD
jgi:hypothetical protein